MYLRSIFFVLAALSSTTFAQQTKSREQSAAQSQQQSNDETVINDDRGRAFIIRRETPALSARGNHERVISDPQQYSIFLGSDWAKPSLRAHEPELANLLANVNDAVETRVLDAVGVKNFFGPTFSQEKLDNFAERNLSDLEIQAVLAGMLKDGSLQAPNPNTICVVYLSQELHSTLGSMIAGKHYVAYHSFFNSMGTKLHYVVVPFEADPKTAYQIALRVFVAAALNPNGTASN